MEYIYIYIEETVENIHPQNNAHIRGGMHKLCGYKYNNVEQHDKF